MAAGGAWAEEKRFLGCDLRCVGGGCWVFVSFLGCAVWFYGVVTCVVLRAFGLSLGGVPSGFVEFRGGAQTRVTFFNVGGGL